MTFVDASAVVAILTREPEADFLALKLERGGPALLSGFVLVEAALAVARKRAVSPETAREAVLAFAEAAEAEWVPIDRGVADLALAAYARFGKGRHPAALNLGDCFSYACARAREARLLFKGDDFALTDIDAA